VACPFEDLEATVRCGVGELSRDVERHEGFHGALRNQQRARERRGDVARVLPVADRDDRICQPGRILRERERADTLGEVPGQVAENRRAHLSPEPLRALFGDPLQPPLPARAALRGVGVCT